MKQLRSTLLVVVTVLALAVPCLAGDVNTPTIAAPTGVVSGAIASTVEFIRAGLISLLTIF